MAFEGALEKSDDDLIPLKNVGAARDSGVGRIQKGAFLAVCKMQWNVRKHSS